MNLRSRKALTPFQGFLAYAGVQLKPVLAAELSEWEQVLDRFGRYLASERGLAPTTVTNYLNQARTFLRWRAERAGEDFGSLSGNEVTAFLLVRAAGESAGSVPVAATGIRALLNWMFLTRIRAAWLKPAPIRPT